ncbi:radical SAM protein [archaeon]|jgi:predicted DNA-binding helix-hairpin-helix protein|nr:radical SAM protein [archaeon]MBT4647156.1 radical SAM protein [archaeon]MBT6822159.1 radical SAM protein [archaeon]MBT7391766.1 radical SAM protein [archaeon]
MDVLEKAKILGTAGKFDSCGPKSCEVNINSGLGGIYHAKAENKNCKIFKTLIDNSCTFDCKYCSNSTSCKTKKTAYKQEELPKLFNYLNKTMDVDGLFLSSGVSGTADKATQKMIDSVKILRNKYNYKGYVHFKVLPGTSYELIKQASELANRMSINIESPNKTIMSELSSCKDYKTDILRRQAWISKMNLSSGHTTQMIVNNISTDKDILKMVDWEYENLKPKRVYYSAFKPIKGTPLENEKATKISRQNFLYNTDFLMRDYGYKLKEFYSIMDDEMLPIQDPKLAIAMQNFDSPIDINESNYEELIRIPGIGPKSAKYISTKKEKITKYEELQKIGIRLNRAKPFISVNGKKQMMLNQF